MRGPRRSLWLATAAALAFTGLQALPTVTASAKPAGSADDHRVVRRSADGRVTFLGSTDARALAASPQAGNAVAAARAHLDQVGRALGLSSPGAELAGGRKTALGQGRSIVRFDQQIGGLPVFAGQVAVSLGADGSLTSVLSDVSPASEVATSSVAQTDATRLARKLTAKVENVPGKGLSVSAEKVVFDPLVVHVEMPGGARPAWRVDVTNGTDVREVVIVDGVSGRVLMHYNQVADALNRRICNNGNVKQSSDVPCTSPVRTEGQGATGNTDVDNAYKLSGQTATAFAAIAGIDLTEFIGKGAAGHRQLRSTVDWCYSSTPCPYANAFWNGEQMYYGDGYASADDVVAHELTHGVTERTANLMYFHQSGAMNESFSDIFGEIVDQRNAQPGEAPDVWDLGEDLPGGAIRNMADPTIDGQPDRMQSGLYEPDNSLSDNGGVHTNSGVGNHLFYLIAHGGSFNSQTVTAIDTDPAFPKSARLFYEALVSLTSGSEYADLANVLRQRCGELATAGTLGFTTGDCDEVEKAILATELDLSPLGDAAQPAEAPDTCPDVGRPYKVVLLDGEAQLNRLVPDNASMWTRAPNPYAPFGVPGNARSGVGSWFVWDPDPLFFGDPADTSLASKAITLPAGQEAYVRFEHWRAFEYSSTPTYYDGGTLDLWQDVGGGTFQPVDNGAYTWENGPQETIEAISPRLGFGGDSHGWVSSRMDLSPMAGNTVKVLWTSHGDASYSSLGWFLDNIEVYTCSATQPTVTGPLHFKAVGAGTPTSPAANLTWDGPASVGSGIAKFQVYKVGGGVKEVLPGDPLPLKWASLKRGTNYTFKVRAVDKDGRVGPLVSHTIRALKIAFNVSKNRVRKGDRVTYSGRVYRADNGQGIKGLKVFFQYKKPTAKKWTTLGYLKTRLKGKYSVRLYPARTFVYRMLVKPSASWFTNVSPTRKVVVR